MVAKNNPNEIKIVRTYDAPVKVVWDAWNDPEQASKWWGPRGFTLTTHGKELRPGGFWSYTMHGPDGTDWVNKTYYYEVEECKKLVYDHGGSDDRPPLFHVTVLFSEVDGKTTMDMTMRLPTAEEADNIRKHIKAAGGNATWDRLAEYLDETLRSQRTFVINRSFQATAEQLFDMWTEPDHLRKWLPPAPFEMTFMRSDVRVGGSCMFKMSDGSNSLYGELQYQEINRPERLVYVQRFCDEQGNAGRHPALPTFPEAMLMIVQFTPEDSENTRVTLISQPCGTVTPEEIQTFVDTRTSMTQGWTGSFDTLETELAEACPEWRGL